MCLCATDTEHQWMSAIGVLDGSKEGPAISVYQIAVG